MRSQFGCLLMGVLQSERDASFAGQAARPPSGRNPQPTLIHVNLGNSNRHCGPRNGSREDSFTLDRAVTLNLHQGPSPCTPHTNARVPTFPPLCGDDSIHAGPGPGPPASARPATTGLSGHPRRDPHRPCPPPTAGLTTQLRSPTRWSSGSRQPSRIPPSSELRPCPFAETLHRKKWATTESAGSGGSTPAPQSVSLSSGPQTECLASNFDPPAGCRELGEYGHLFRHWRDLTNAVRMNDWIDVLLHNHRLLRDACTLL